MLNNPTPEVLTRLEEYVCWQVLYINDCACNQVIFLESELKNVHYNGKGAKILYNAARKRVASYLELVNALDFDEDYLVEMSSQMDEYMDGPANNLKKEIQRALDENNIERSSWVAAVETARLITHYAVEVSKQYLSKIQNVSTKCRGLWYFNLSELSNVMEQLGDFVFKTSNVGDKNVDLNKDERVLAAFKKFVKAFTSADNFTTASANTNAMF